MTAMVADSRSEIRWGSQRKAGAMPRVPSRPDGRVERGFVVPLWTMGQTRLRGDCHLCELWVANSSGEASLRLKSRFLRGSKMSNSESSDIISDSRSRTFRVSEVVSFRFSSSNGI